MPPTLILERFQAFVAIFVIAARAFQAGSFDGHAMPILVANVITPSWPITSRTYFREFV